MAQRPTSSYSRRLLVIASLAAAVQLLILWCTSVPLGVPNEWTWARLDFPLFNLLSLWPGIAAGSLLWWYVRRQSRVIQKMPPAAQRRSLLGLWVLGTLWMLCAIDSISGIAGLSRVPFVLYYTRSSGYFTQAREVGENLPQFYATYRERIADSTQAENYLHMGTHPPGLTTAFVLINRMCDRSKGIRDLILATQPSSVRESYAVIGQNLNPEARKTWQADQAALWLATLIVTCMTTGAAIPLFYLARRGVCAEAAWWTASFWLLVPAAAVFLPKSDVMFAGLAMLIQWLWLEGIDWRSAGYGVAAGTLIFLAVCLSLAFAPLGLMMFLQWIFITPSEKSHQRPRFDLGRWNLIFSSGVVFLGLIGMAHWLGGINLISVWLQNLRNHASFYSHATRTYLSWLFVNPLELSFSLGLPLAMLAFTGLYWLARNVAARNPVPGVVSPASGGHRMVELLIPAAVWGILWLSGKNMGEAARLWVFLMPYAVWTASLTLQKFLDDNDKGARGRLSLCFAIQLAVCLGTVVRIDGFHFAELMP